MGVIWHDDEGVEFVSAFGPIVLESFQEEFGVRGDLKEAAAAVSDGGDEEGAGGGGSLRDGHYAASIVGREGMVGDAGQVGGGPGFRARVNRGQPSALVAQADEKKRGEPSTEW